MKPDYKAFMKLRNAKPHAVSEGWHFAPHCDLRVLHRPTNCTYCAMPEFQDLHTFRIEHGINYTGEATAKWPCPAEQDRSLALINRWSGNLAKPEGCTCGYFVDMDNPCGIHRDNK